MEEKHVQTTVSEVVYDVLWKEAKKEHRPLKAILREAIEAHARRVAPLEEDPIWKFVGRGTLKERDWSTRKDWRAK